jgi:CSLREA domain-containing protein
MREHQPLLPWCREAVGTVRRALAAARAWLERPLSGRNSLLSAFLLVGLAATSRAAFAAGDTVVVNTLDDEIDPNDQKCSLREAIGNINDQAPTHADCTDGNGRDLIYFSESGTIKLTHGPLSLGGHKSRH